MSKTTPREFLLQHPSDATRVIAYSIDEPGYRAALFVAGQRVASRESATATRRQARRALIGWAIELGFFAVSDLDDATDALDRARVEELPRRLRTLVDVVRSFDVET